VAQESATGDVTKERHDDTRQDDEREAVPEHDTKDTAPGQEGVSA